MNSKKRMVIFSVCYLAYTLIYVARLNLSVASPALIDAMILDKAEIGMMGSVFSVVYAIGRLLNGYISDKCPPYVMIGLGLLVVGISNSVMGMVTGLYALLFLWGCNAYAQSMLWGPVLKTVASIYDEETAKKKTSYMVTSVATGNIIGILLNTFIINSFGFRFAFIVPGIMTLAACLLVVILLPKDKEDKEKLEKSHISMFSLLGDESIKRVIVPALLHGVIKDNISVWMTVYFVDKYNINLTQSAGFVLFIPIIGLIGRLLYPACYKLCRYREHRVSVYAFIVCAAASAVLCIKGVPPVLAAACLSIIYASVSIANTSILSIFPLHFAKTGNVASVSGIMDFATYFGAGVSSLIYGVVIKYIGYLPMYLSWTVISVISMVILLPYALKNKE